eukprot:Hpha_TRINITY_DN22495_c0_g1::TRINITY_DN22495_c0_g1_i1::g.95104::m.95104
MAMSPGRMVSHKDFVRAKRGHTVVLQGTSPPEQSSPGPIYKVPPEPLSPKPEPQRRTVSQRELQRRKDYFEFSWQKDEPSPAAPSQPAPKSAREFRRDIQLHCTGIRPPEHLWEAAESPPGTPRARSPRSGGGRKHDGRQHDVGGRPSPRNPGFPRRNPESPRAAPGPASAWPEGAVQRLEASSPPLDLATGVDPRLLIRTPSPQAPRRLWPPIPWDDPPAFAPPAEPVPRDPNAPIRSHAELQLMKAQHGGALRNRTRPHDSPPRAPPQPPPPLPRHNPKMTPPSIEEPTPPAPAPRPPPPEEDESALPEDYRSFRQYTELKRRHGARRGGSRHDGRESPPLPTSPPRPGPRAGWEAGHQAALWRQDARTRARGQIGTHWRDWTHAWEC